MGRDILVDNVTNRTGQAGTSGAYAGHLFTSGPCRVVGIC